MSLTLYHYTCDHSAPLIQEAGHLAPQLVWGPGQLVWLTDLAVPIREALGLTSHWVTCDRTAWRFTVLEPERATPWWEWRRAHPGLMWAYDIQLADGARPAHWWVSVGPVAVELPGERR